MDHEPCDTWFEEFWRLWLRRQAGLAAPEDRVKEQAMWLMSYEIRRRIEKWEDRKSVV